MSKLLLIPVGMLFCIAIFPASFLIFHWNKRRKNKFSPFCEKTLNLPGHSLGEMYEEQADQLTSNYLLFLFVCFGFVVAMNMGSLTQALVTSIVCLSSALYLLKRSWKIVDRMRNIKLGQDGERYTGQELNLLMLQGAYVFHDIHYKYGNIDHVVIGNDRVFTIETKTRRSNVKNGDSGDDVVVKGNTIAISGYESNNEIRQAKRHAEFLKEFIKSDLGIDFPVFAVVAFPGRTIITRSNPIDVQVINPARGNELKGQLGELTDIKKRNEVICLIEKYARTSSSNADNTDPDAKDKYDFWLNRKTNTKKIIGTLT